LPQNQPHLTVSSTPAQTPSPTALPPIKKARKRRCELQYLRENEPDTNFTISLSSVALTTRRAIAALYQPLFTYTTATASVFISTCITIAGDIRSPASGYSISRTTDVHTSI
jgi:hypothetical protein